MRVNPEGGVCRTCGGQLEIIDADDATMTVECMDPGCADEYLVEPDAFGDGAMYYYVQFLAAQAQSRTQEEDV